MKRFGLITDISHSKAKATLYNRSSSFLPPSAIATTLRSSKTGKSLKKFEFKFFVKSYIVLGHTMQFRVVRRITNILYYNFAWEYVLYPPFLAFFDKTYFWKFQNGGFGEIFNLTVFCQSLLHFENFFVKIL